MEQTGTPAAQRPDYEAMITAALTTIAAQQSAPKPAVQTPSAPAATATPAAPVAASVTPAPSSPEPASPSATQNDGRARVKSILGAEAAKQRQDLAMHLALETDIPVDTALAILNAAPVPAAATAEQAPADPLAAAMQHPGNSGGVKPAAPAASGRGSFVDFVEAQTKKSA